VWGRLAGSTQKRDRVNPDPFITPPPIPTVTPLGDVTAPSADSLRNAERDRLDRSLVRGMAWTGSIKWSTQIVAWGATVLVARKLSPGDYGLIGMASVYLGLLTLLSEFGIGTSIVTKRELGTTQLAELNSVAGLLGMTFFVLSCLLAKPISLYFATPQLTPVIIALSGSLAISSMRTVPQASMQREMRFARLAGIDGVSALTLSGASIAFAYAGFGYWTLVAASLLSATITTALMNYNAPIGFARPNFAGLRSTLGLSRDVLLSRLAWYTYQNADFLVAGKLLGKDALGAYSFAFTLAYAPSDKVSSLVIGVAPAIFSGSQHDKELLRRYLKVMASVITLAVLPATIGLALVANDLVLAVLGQKWQVMILPLQLLAIYAAIRSMVPLVAQVLIVAGEAAFNRAVNLFAAVILPVGFVVASRWGITGLAASWIVLHPTVLVIPMFRRMCRLIEMKPSEYADAMRPAVVGCMWMAVGVIAFAYLHPSGMSGYLVLAIKIVIGALAYAATLLLGYRSRVTALVRALRMLRS
jgi:O-antigen/teichoic acid export membrane protein